MSNLIASPNMHDECCAEHFRKKDERLKEECDYVTSRLISLMKTNDLPVCVRISKEFYEQVEWRFFRPQTPTRKAFLKKLALEGGVPAKKIYIGLYAGIHILP